MQIQSAFSSGVQGLQRAEQGVREASLEIARQPLAKENEAAEAGSETASAQPQSSTPVQPVTEQLVKLKLEERNAQANSQVIRTADQVVGSLIDTRA